MSHIIDPKQTQARSQNKKSLEKMERDEKIEQAQDKADEKNTTKKPRLDKIITFALLFGGILVWRFLDSTDILSNSDAKLDSWVKFIPIWIAIFIPIFIAKRNKKIGNDNPNQIKDLKIIMAFLVGITVLVVAGTIYFAVSSK
jgi:hypothetical protein